MKPGQAILLAIACVALLFAWSGCKSTRHAVRSKSDQFAPIDPGTRELIMSGDPKAAERRVRDLLRHHPYDGVLLNEMGSLLYRQDRMEEAATYYARALELLPTAIEPRHNLGMVLEDAGRLDEAIEWYRRAAALAPTNLAVAASLTRAEIRSGDESPGTVGRLQDLAEHHPSASWRAWAGAQLERRRGP